MLALPPAAPPAPRRQLLVGTALACFGAATLLGGMLALWMQFRTDAIAGPEGVWKPADAVVPEVATNVMLIAFLPICVFAQWAVYAARRDDKPHAALALGLTALLGLAVVNAQAFVYAQMALPVSGGAYHSMFYALTGLFTLLVVFGIGFSAVTAFRYLGGRTTEREVVAAHALYWYFLSAAYSGLWLVVYVTK